MDTIDNLLLLADKAIEQNDQNDGLGVLDWATLTDAEKKKFNEHFYNVGEDEAVMDYKGKQFVMKIINYD